MEITLKMLTGKQFKFLVMKTDTIELLKHKILDKEGIEPERQRILGSSQK